MLIDELKQLQANTFAYYAKAHYYHWNIEGPNFVEYHKFLEKIYTDAYEAVDTIAEFCRQLDVYAPGAWKMLRDTDIQDDDTIPDALEMMRRLHNDNEIVILSLMTCYKTAEDHGEIGLSNFIQDRIIKHRKFDWMLRSLLK